DAAKIIGCWNGLSKRPGRGPGGTGGGFAPGAAPMRRAVAFTADIASSKHLTKTFAEVVAGLEDHPDTEGTSEALVQLSSCEVRHVDGTMHALERHERLDWLKADPGPGTARILSNA